MPDGNRRNYRVSVCLTVAERHALEEIADREDRSFSQCGRLALLDWLRNRGAPIRAARAER